LPSELGHAVGFGPMAKGIMKSFLIFQFQFKSVQTSKIHISLLRAPKIMKLVQLNS
jgi:hypothetical protein